MQLHDHYANAKGYALTPLGQDFGAALKAVPHAAESYVVWDPKVHDSINAALTAAGVHRAIAVTEAHIADAEAKRAERIAAFVAEDFWKIELAHEATDEAGSPMRCSFNWARGHLFDRLAVLVLYEACVRRGVASIVSVGRRLMLDSSSTVLRSRLACSLLMRSRSSYMRSMSRALRPPTTTIVPSSCSRPEKVSTVSRPA